MLAGLQGGFGPTSMQTVRHGYIDGVDAWVREQLRVGAVRRGNLVLCGEPAGAFEIACRDGCHLNLRLCGRGDHHGDRCDPRRPENPEADSCPVRVTRCLFGAFLMSWFRYHVHSQKFENLGAHYALRLSLLSRPASGKPLVADSVVVRPLPHVRVRPDV